MRLPDILFVILYSGIVAAKAMGRIELSWLWISLPVWLPLVAILAVGIVAFIYSIFSKS